MFIDVDTWIKLGSPKITILLDSKEIKHCVEADDKANYLIVEETDENDEVIIDEKTQCIITKKLEGDVYIIIESDKEIEKEVECINWKAYTEKL